MKEYYVGPSYSKKNMKVSNAVWTFLILSLLRHLSIYPLRCGHVYITMPNLQVYLLIYSCFL